MMMMNGMFLNAFKSTVTDIHDLISVLLPCSDMCPDTVLCIIVINY